MTDPLRSYFVSWGMAAVGAVVALAALAGVPPFDPASFLLAVASVVLTERTHVTFNWDRVTGHFTLIEASIVAILLLMPPVHAVAAVVLGYLLARGYQLRMPHKVVFNVSQIAVATAAAGAIVHLSPPIPPLIGGSSVVGVVVALAVYAAINVSAFVGLLSRYSDERLETIRPQVALTVAATMGTTAVGILLAGLWEMRPSLVPFLLAPAAAVHLATRESVRSAAAVARTQAEHERLNRIVDGASDGILLLDRAGQIQVWNPAMEHLTGLPASEVVGERISHVLTDEQRLAEQPIWTSRIIDEADRNLPHRTLDATLIDRDGTERMVRESHTLVFDERGRCTGDVVVVRDVSRQAELEALRSDFVARVSHELRTPLTPIRGFARVLLSRGTSMSPDQHKEALERIVERADHLSELVEDLLLVTQLERRELEELARPRTLDLAGVVEAAVDRARSQAPTRRINLHVTPGTGAALADPDRVQQILQALLANAVTYTPEDSPIEVSVHQDGDDICVEVIDHGPGIPADQREAIFDQFHRLEDPLTMRTGGVGLGLFIARRLAHAMNGDLVLRDVPGAIGATFVLRVPAAEPVTDHGSRSTQAL